MDNPMKGIVDAIAEADNEIGGQLITRLRESHRHGRNDGEVAAADPDRLVSPVDVFKSTDEGHLIDILEKDTPSGNEGTYIIDTYVDAKNVDLTTLSGGAPGFVNEDPVQWRFASLRVESTYEFPERDHRQQVYVGSELDPIPYAEIVQTPGAQELRGLGAHRFSRLGATLETTSPQTLVSREEFFTAADVGKALWILPAETSTGNEGGRVIATFVNTREVTFSGTAIAADETNARFLVKTYDGAGYLTILHRAMTEVIEGSRSYSGLDLLRRSLLVDLAVEEELDRIARRFGMKRPRSLVDDEIWRQVIMVRAYLAASPVYSLELLLAALFPEGGWGVDEDLTLEDLDGRPRHANEVFLTIPDLAPGSEYRGRTFLSGPETVTSTSTTTATIGETPITVVSVRLAPIELELDMDVLPSADTPAWTYQAETVGTEGTFFSVVSDGDEWTPAAGKTTSYHLKHVADNPGNNSGRYYRTIAELDTLPRYQRWEVSGFWRRNALTTTNGWPWHLRVRDGEISALLEWDEDDIRLNGSVIGSGSLTGSTAWHHFRMIRNGADVYAYLDHDLLIIIPVSSFGADSNTDVSFGHLSQAASQDWEVWWDNIKFRTFGQRDYWNLARDDGSLSTGSDILTSAAALFISADTGKHVFLDASNEVNWGLWEATWTSATQLTLSGISHSETGRVYTDDSGDHWVESLDPDFNKMDIGKDIIISGSDLSPPQDRTVTITDYVNEHLVQVSNPGADFIDEDELDWEFDTDFTTESSIPWELVAVGTNVTTALTFRETLPNHPTDLDIQYTDVLSAELLRNEFVQNLGTAPDLYYPFYLLDVDEGIRSLIELCTAAGVIPRFDEPD
jgi:hypothetical protein